jgi:hypothetical protein
MNIPPVVHRLTSIVQQLPRVTGLNTRRAARLEAAFQAKEEATKPIISTSWGSDFPFPSYAPATVKANWDTTQRAGQPMDLFRMTEPGLWVVDAGLCNGGFQHTFFDKDGKYLATFTKQGHRVTP